MHPILGRAERLAAYLAAWVVVCVLLAAVFTRLGLSWVEALALLLPLCLVYAFVCLSAWYVSRAVPLRTSSVMQVLASSALAASIASGLWLGLTEAWVTLLNSTDAFAPAADRYAQQIPFVFAAGVLLFLLALAVHYALLAFEAAREAERRQLELELLTRDAELRALRAQIDPHFLYNSLNSISALTVSDPPGARRMCVLLGGFLRDTLSLSSRERIPLAEELALADSFLSIEQVRFGARLQVDRRIDDASAACLVPPLLLQPLVENAITHGIAGLLEGGVIRLDIARRNGHCSIRLENPCEPDTRPARSGGMGLDNVRRRLAATFGRDASMEIHAGAEQFRVELYLPCTTDE
jgi:hypothetical protein